MKDTVKINLKDICNLSRIPTSIKDNPVSKAASSENIYDYLEEYYKNISYKNLNDLYRTNIKKLNRLSHTTHFLPWYHKKPVQSFEDGAFITKLPESSIRKKELKIQQLIKSIKEKGYRPEKFIDRKMGHVTGYFLRNKIAEKFYVVSGNHRVAVLHSLGYEKIPVLIENKSFFKERDKVEFGYDEMPVYIDRSRVDYWPSVQSNFLNKKEALEIFDSFVGVQI